MKERKLSPQEMALAAAIGVIPRKQYSTSVETTARIEPREQAAEFHCFNNFDLLWMRKMGIRLD